MSHLNGGSDNVDILGDMYYKFLVQDCMWSGTCKEDNSHENTNKFSDFSYFSTSPVYGSIFDIFNIEDENSLGEISCDPEYDTSDQDDSPLNGLSAEDTEIVDDSNEPTPSCSTSSTISPTPSTSSQSTLTGISTISQAGNLIVPDCGLIKPTTSNSRSTSTGKSSTTSIKSTISSKATKSSSKVNSLNAKPTISASSVGSSIASTSNIRSTQLTNSLVNSTISATSSAAAVTNSVLNSQLATNNINNTTPSIIKVEATGTSSAPATAVGISTTSILKNTGKPRNSKSLYPERRKEHNNSEKKRRDHLRNAFNHLRDQIPKLKDGEKKAARVTILKESVSYVTLLKEKHRYLERTKNAETIKRENLLKRLKMLQSSTGAIFNQQQQQPTTSSNANNDSNLVYVQCNSSTVC